MRRATELLAQPTPPAAAAGGAGPAHVVHRKYWVGLWRRLPVPNPVKAFAWKLAHGALPCNAMVAGRLQRAHRDGLGCQCCPPPPVAGGPSARAAPRPPETLTHLFLECPAFAGAVQWLSDLWVALGGAAPPLTLEVIVAGEPGAWPAAPAEDSDEAARWHALRLTLLYHIWAARCSRDSRQQSARAVVTTTVAALCSDIRLQYNRAFCAQLLQRHLPNRQLAMRRLAPAQPTFVVWLHPKVARLRERSPMQPRPPSGVDPPPELELLLDIHRPVPAPAAPPPPPAAA